MILSLLDGERKGTYSIIVKKKQPHKTNVCITIAHNMNINANYFQV